MPNFETSQDSQLSKKPKEVITITDDNLEASVNETFNDKLIENIEVDENLESKGVAAVAGEALRSDELIQKYIASGHEEIVKDVIKKMTMDPELIEKFYGKLADAPDKAAHIETATKRLTDAMKEIVVMEVLLKEEPMGNA